MRRAGSRDRRRDVFARLYLESSPPIDAADLGPGARLLVPHGGAFGAPQLIRDGTFWDWVKDEPDAYWVAGERTSTHSGADIAFFVGAGSVYPLPAGVPVRALLAGRVEWTGRRSDPGSRHGVVLRHGGGAPGANAAPFVYSHYADIDEAVREGARVRRGQVIGHARPYSRAHPTVIVHVGIGVYVRGWGADPIDPTFLLRRWRVRHPVGADSTCRADAFDHVDAGRWLARGRIERLVACARWDPAWRDRWR